MERGNAENWRATLTPHRSLSRQGFLAVMGLVAGVNLVAGLVFYAIGAWPVAGFCGLDVALLWFAFHRNFIDARRCEVIEVTRHELILERLAQGHRPTEQRFVRRWVRVELEEEPERELIGGLYLKARGSRTEIGSFLAPFERKDLALALKSALASPHI